MFFSGAISLNHENRRELLERGDGSPRAMIRLTWRLSGLCRDGLTGVKLATIPMQVRILFFGVLKELAGKSSEWIELRDGASVEDVLEHYVAEIPRIKESLASLAVAVNQQYAGAETVLKADDEVALLPPVSGGSGEGPGEISAGQPAGR